MMMSKAFKRICMLCALMAGFIPGVRAQGITVTGTVKDQTGAPLPGATVAIQSTTRGTMTGLDGRYSIQAREGDVLVFSCLGYADMEITVGKQREINVTLSDNSTVLDEVVVVGYGTQRKESVVGAITSVKGDAVSAEEL